MGSSHQNSKGFGQLKQGQKTRGNPGDLSGD